MSQFVWLWSQIHPLPPWIPVTSSILNLIQRVLIQFYLNGGTACFQTATYWPSEVLNLVNSPPQLYLDERLRGLNHLHKDRGCRYKLTPWHWYKAEKIEALGCFLEGHHISGSGLDIIPFTSTTCSAFQIGLNPLKWCIVETQGPEFSQQNSVVNCVKNFLKM